MPERPGAWLLTTARRRAIDAFRRRAGRAGLDLVDRLVADGALTEFHHLYVVRGELLARLGRRAEARGEYLHAAAMCTNAAERTVLEDTAASAAGA